MPETKDSRRRLHSVWNRHDAILGDDLKAPGAAPEAEERPDNARNDGQHNALDKSKSGLVFGGHSSDFSDTVAVLAEMKKKTSYLGVRTWTPKSPWLSSLDDAGSGWWEQ
jgi:hypothetical protein